MTRTNGINLDEVELLADVLSAMKLAAADSRKN